MIKRFAISAPVLAVAATLFVAPSTALATTGHEATGSKKQVTACSKRGNFKCVTARTKTTSLGKKYLSPGGNWKWCGGDCKDQLRKDHVDFWYYQKHQ